MKRINIITNKPETGKALARYLKFVLEIDDIVLGDLKDPYKQKEAFLKASTSDFLLVDGFINEKPRGFQFAKTMKMNALILFYYGEMRIEAEGPFWLVLPNGIERLASKLKELISKSTASIKVFEKLENQFPVLQESHGYHRY
jgi:hypothetical protein